MSKLVLFNDVTTDNDESNLLIGNCDIQANKEGFSQSDIIVEQFYKNCEFDIHLVYSSDALRVKKIVHKLRVKSKDQSITSSSVRRLVGLRERDFGVLNNTPIHFDSDIFSHSRIKPEKGESVFECRVRSVDCIVKILNKNKNIVVLSHPFLCQIFFNAILQKDHTLLTEFWQLKGSYVIMDYEFGSYGIKWNFLNANNTLSNTTYTQDQIYSNILGKQRTFSI